MSKPIFVLASASPARQKLLNNIGISPQIIPSNFDESLIQILEPDLLVQELALAKAKTVAESLTISNALVLGCDSLLVVNGEIHGKPNDPQEAIARWQIMQGQMGELYTGHALIDLVTNQTLVRSAVTQVYFATVSQQEIKDYVATGEPLQCAGAFAIEGKGGVFIEKLVGCHTNVIGLSLPLLRQMLKELNHQITDFWL
ncbi:MAG: Maf family protein [Microcoleaceae cyanobacterium]